MNLPSYTIRSSTRFSGVAGLTAALLLGCGGSAPPPERAQTREPTKVETQNQAGEKGAGGINFHFANKTTDAHMSIDLGSTEVYLEMSGRPANAEDAAAMQPPPQKERGKPTSKNRNQEQAAQSGQEDQEQEEQKPEPKQEQKPEKTSSKTEKHQPPAAKPDSEEESANQDQSSNEDVTSKVLTGIRKAQELFYQKRYPEAMAMVRQSLDAQPTAEGHALAGSISYMMGKNGLARRHWEDALRLNPDMPAVENMLQRTRTPGGRGSPAPRPLISRPAPRPPASVIEAAGPEVADGAPFPEEAAGDNTSIQKFDSEGRLGSPKNSSPPAIAQPAMAVPSPVIAPAPSASPTPPPQPAPDIAAEKPAAPVPEKASVEPQEQTKPEASVEAKKPVPTVPPAAADAPSKPVFPTKKAKGK